MVRRAPTIALVVVLLAGCAARRWYEGRVVHPAELPVRSFAPVAFVPAPDGDSADVAEALAGHVSATGTSASVTDAGAASIASARLVVAIAVRFTSRTETRWGTRPENVCGAYGCFLRQVSYPFEVYHLVAEASVRVRESRDVANVAERIARVEDAGPDSMARRAALRRRLVGEIATWFDPRVETVRVHLPRLGDEAYARALEAAERGRWDEARALLRAVRDAPAFTSRPSEERAEVLVALAMATRFAAATEAVPVPMLEEALAIATEAAELDSGTPRVALREAIRAQLDEARILAVQRGDAAAAAGAIVVPDSYR